MEISILGVKYTEEDVSVRDAKDALVVQNACNISGVIFSMAECMKRLCEHPRCTGTAWRNHHPVIVMYLTQCVFLSTGDSVDHRTWLDAEALCNYVLDVSKEDL